MKTCSHLLLKGIIILSQNIFSYLRLYSHFRYWPNWNSNITEFNRIDLGSFFIMLHPCQEFVRPKISTKYPILVWFRWFHFNFFLFLVVNFKNWYEVFSVNVRVKGCSLQHFANRNEKFYTCLACQFNGMLGSH